MSDLSEIRERYNRFVSDPYGTLEEVQAHVLDVLRVFDAIDEAAELIENLQLVGVYYRSPNIVTKCDEWLRKVKQ